MLSENETGLNSCLHFSLSEIIEKENKLIFPKYYLEDYFIDYFTDNEIEYFNENSKQYYIIKNFQITWETLYLLKTESYSAYNWYPYLKKFTYKSDFIKINDIYEINNLLKDLTFPKFIKLDTLSCKDTSHSGIFYNVEEVYNTFKESSRIINTLNNKTLSKYNYLFIREPDFNLSHEYRCFIRKLRLTAVSSDVEVKDRNKLENFINQIIEYLPFNDAVIDIKLEPEPMLIEINNFGADSPAGAGKFNWKEDYFILYGGMDEVVYRF
jgi:hypothetical protein